ncbi:hypothetical protein SPRG_00901 [Saprolegnia parasitica CBS 223.65]|uniref:Uncharacterized protein n=1 Tax=Saprolegnia parasitica (strain CBS 223.65) TaxID=695850 RepID=A0A067D003_SAPPC|nr:hypothetical protein SPRG_00901 [Saprolegnia parasitica CBS 223.65]KDO34840.1 hypothetical protein SPRG_00901 [Saprolegnia parasitica CBS 223.65]|eukprot:XP_012194503.1 hypothetical protein SPRG_00901 [Saprolegnia parasitica CBS 223.65]
MPSPNVIIQIAYKNESLFGRRAKLDLSSPEGSAARHQRGHETTELEFGQRRAETHGHVTEKDA